MAIRIVRNANGNCIQFVGTSQPVYWNACLSGAVNDEDNTRVDVINDIRTTDSDNPFYEFFGIPYTEFRDRDGNAFANSQEAADYITAQANVLGGAVLFGAQDNLDVARDATNTNLLFSTGDSYGVNSIKAIAQDDGNIKITENVDNGTVLFQDIRPNNVTVSGDKPTTTTAAAVVNTLNALFTVTPLGLGGVDPADSFATAGTTLTNSAMTIFGDVTESGMVYTKGTNTGSQVNDGMYSAAVLTAEGEYFEFDTAGHSGDNLFGGAFVMGLKNGADAVTEITNNTENMGGLDLAVRFRGMNSAENHDYGIVIENGFYENPKNSTKFRLGLDANRRLYISHFNASENEWQVLVRSAFQTTTETYRVVFFLKRENAFLPLDDAKYEEVDPLGTTLQYRYIESPDGDFYYPLFATEIEANFVDSLNGGSGSNHQHVFSDELPTSNIWYMPDNGGTHAGSSAPANTDSITYTEILTGEDVNYVPTSFGTVTQSVSEGQNVNLQLDPAGAFWTTTISGQPTGMSLSNGNLVGTAPEVSGVIATNPSDDYTITVTRTNAFGTSTGTLTLTVNNLTTVITPISGFTHVSTTAAMVDSDTMDDGSMVTFDDTLEPGNRWVFARDWVRTYIKDQMTHGNNHKFYLGIKANNTPTSNFDTPAIQTGFQFEKNSSNSLYVRWINNGTIYAQSTYTGAWPYELTFINDTDNSGYTTVLLTSGNGATVAVPTSSYVQGNGIQGSNLTHTMAWGVQETTADISLTGISEVANPVVGPLTDWDNAVDFSGSSERLEISNNSYYRIPQKMSGQGVTVSAPSTSGYTTNANAGRPWACSIVFRADGNSSNQHIWNAGEGTGSTDDNIYLRYSATGQLFFGWGRDGALNECAIGSITANRWYGIYIGHNGTRLSGSNATAANLASAFDIRLTTELNNWATPSYEYSNSSNWTAGSTGGRMDRAVAGTLTIGGRGGNRTFHGKVAAFVNTSLKLNTAMPSDAEIEMMITDPVQWLQDYKVGQSYRPNWTYNNSNNFQIGDGSSAYATQVWLMGDGTTDSYSNGIRNQVQKNDNTYTKLNFVSMASNDIETVSITGLS